MNYNIYFKYKLRHRAQKSWNKLVKEFLLSKREAVDLLDTFTLPKKNKEAMFSLASGHAQLDQFCISFSRFKVS